MSKDPQSPTPPPSQNTRRPIAKPVLVIGILLSVVYLLNFTLGIFEIPDNLPIVGNIDEFVASTILLACLHQLGFDLPGLGKK